jgi:RimJ/RimL family protein N-acetyltransferase
VLRRLTDEDVPWIVEGCNDPEFVRWTRWNVDIPHPYSGEDARRFIQRADRAWDEGARAMFAIADAETGRGRGVIDLHLDVRGEPGLASVGYWVLARERGRSSASRALRLISRWALGELGVERLYLGTAPGNVASQRVAERAGFTREGVLRAHLPTATGRRDTVIFSLLPSDLEAQP